MFINMYGFLNHNSLMGVGGVPRERAEGEATILTQLIKSVRGPFAALWGEGWAGRRC